jgi:hypothetical protein
MSGEEYPRAVWRFPVMIRKEGEHILERQKRQANSSGRCVLARFGTTASIASVANVSLTAISILENKSCAGMIHVKPT